MSTWRAFAAARPDVAEIGRRMLYTAGPIGLGFLATVRADGGPRTHPVCPLLTDEGLYAFIVPGPKRDDLHRDDRYALHSETFPPPHHDDAFYVTGTAALVPDPAVARRSPNSSLRNATSRSHATRSTTGNCSSSGSSAAC